MAIQRALLSVSDKTGLVEFAKGLYDFGVELLSTGGTAAALREAGLPVIDVSTFTGAPELFEGRVKTLHPKVHGGLLHKRDDETHLEQAQEYDIPPIDISRQPIEIYQRIVEFGMRIERPAGRSNEPRDALVLTLGQRADRVSHPSGGGVLRCRARGEREREGEAAHAEADTLSRSPSVASARERACAAGRGSNLFQNGRGHPPGSRRPFFEAFLCGRTRPDSGALRDAGQVSPEQDAYGLHYSIGDTSETTRRPSARTGCASVATEVKVSSGAWHRLCAPGFRAAGGLGRRSIVPCTIVRIL